jgi:hypothetical protein
MTIRDRRSGDDRRRLERFKVNIQIDWEGLVGKKVGTISDLSTVGCFVLCSGEVEDSEKVKIFFPLTDGRKIQLWGEVANHIYEIGFAMRFIELTDAQKDFLEVFVDTLRED